MKSRLFRVLSLACLALLTAAGVPLAARAQDGGQRYENSMLGVAFDLPAGWQVAVASGGLIAAAPADLSAVQAGGAPQGLTLRIVIGSFSELGVVDAAQLPDLLARLVPSSVTPPAPEGVQWGSASGYQALVALPDGLTTKIALLAIAGGRVAVVRGLAPSPAWDGGAGAQFDAIAGSLAFSLPQRDENLIQTITSNDGGVFWHYQSALPESGRVVQAGGITFDMFDVMYLAVGPGGVLALDMKNGESISYMGPWYGGNFVDIAIGPDTKLYLANTAADTLNAVMVVDRAGNWTRGWGVRGDGDGEFAPGMPVTVAVTPQGQVWTVSEGHSSGIRDRLYQFDTFGNLLLTVDLAAINPDLAQVHLDASPKTGTLYLVGRTGFLNVVDANGQPLVVNLAQEILQGLAPLDIAIAPDNNIILALPAPGLNGFGLLELSVAGSLLDVFGFPYDVARGGPFLPGEYQQPGGLVVGPDGRVYMTETNPDSGYTHIQAITFSGDGLLPLGRETAAQSGGTGSVQASDPAQGGGLINDGDTVRGALNNRYPVHEWTFNGRAGDHIVITMIDASGAGLLDPKINLNQSDGRTIASNDDVGTSPPQGLQPRDARLEFDLPGDGIYIIQATRFGGRGEYVLTLEVGQ